jgi:hypothetical protein
MKHALPQFFTSLPVQNPPSLPDFEPAQVNRHWLGFTSLPVTTKNRQWYEMSLQFLAQPGRVAPTLPVCGLSQHCRLLARPGSGMSLSNQCRFQPHNRQWCGLSLHYVPTPNYFLILKPRTDIDVNSLPAHWNSAVMIPAINADL